MAYSLCPRRAASETNNTHQQDTPPFPHRIEHNIRLYPIERLRQLLPYPYDPPLVTGPRAERISLRKRLTEFAKKSALESVYRSGNVFPSVFLGVVGGDANYFSLQLASLDSVREAAREHLANTYANADAYAFAYDSAVDFEGSECDAVIIESAARDDPLASELAVVYDRPKRLIRHEFVCGETDNLLEE